MENENNNQLTVVEPNNSLSAFSSIGAFESAQRMANALAKSDLVPKEYRGNIANCLIALEVAQRTGSSIMAVTQSLNIIHGRPSWSSSYIIAALNSCGRFAPIRFHMEGEGMKRSCYAWTLDKTGERLEGPAVTMEMAKAEGWIDKAGSKWKTMPDLMLRYRAGAFFGRLYAPDILFGMQTDDEIKDVTPASEPSPGVKSINEKIKKAKSKTQEEIVVIDQPATTSHTSESDTNTNSEPMGSETLEKEFF